MAVSQPAIEASTETAMETAMERREREILIAKWGWQKFNQLFPDEAACVKELNERAGKTSSCLCCLRTGWHIAGNYVARVRKIRPWFAALWLHEQGIKVSGSQFADFAMVSKSTSATILRSVARLDSNDAESSDGTEISTSPETQNLIQLSEYKPAQKLNRVKSDSASEPAAETDSSQGYLPKESEDEDKEGSEVKIAIKNENSNLAASKKKQEDELAEVKERFLALLSDDPQSFEVLQNKLDAPGNLASVVAILLELDGLITELPGNRFVKAKKQESKSTSRKKIAEPLTQHSSQPIRTTIFKSIFGVVKTAVKDVLQLIFHEASQFFGICKDCKRKLQQKKI